MDFAGMKNVKSLVCKLLKLHFFIFLISQKQNLYDYIIAFQIYDIFAVSFCIVSCIGALSQANSYLPVHRIAFKIFASHRILSKI